MILGTATHPSLRQPTLEVALFTSLLAASHAANPPARDTFSDTWVATDVLGRSLPTNEQVGPPRSALGWTTLPPHLDFKWADNIQQTGDWSDFTLNGDTAPNDRFNYRAKLATGK